MRAAELLCEIDADSASGCLGRRLDDARLEAARTWARQLTDVELRDALRRMSTLQAQARCAPVGARLQTIELLQQRCPQALRVRCEEEAGVAPGALEPGDFAEQLQALLGVAVAVDGVIEVDRLSSAAADLIGELPLAMYHHTSTALIEDISRDGLLVGRQTNFFNTQQGVYLSTMSAGEPVSIYARRAARVHGGEPTVLRVRRRLSQLTADPDDADLAWAEGRQYISAPVPPHDVLWEEESAPREGDLEASAAQAEPKLRM